MAGEEAVGPAEEVAGEHVGHELVHGRGGHHQQHDSRQQLRSPVETLEEQREPEEPLTGGRVRGDGAPPCGSSWVTSWSTRSSVIVMWGILAA
ncbi:hypothetical protein GCM10009609_75740 [Pseudonocardia aurantiaca]